MARTFSLKPLIDALTLTRNGYKRLKTLHHTLITQSIADRVRWHLWDNASTQKGVRDLIKKLANDPMVGTVHRSETNRSFSDANDVLAARGEAPYILLLNDDIAFIQKDTLERMVAIMEADPTVGAVGARLLFRDGKIQHGGVFFTKNNQGGIAVGHVGYGVPNDQAGILSDRRVQQAVTGALMLVRRDVWEQVGGLDTRFWFCFEDVHLCLKVGKLGYKVVYDGQSVAIHDESMTFKENGGDAKKIANAQRNYHVLQDCIAEMGLFPVDDLKALHRSDYPQYQVPANA